jgi:2-phospho-L-lactate transferase/gluconeogenesis factor (CofD/UPF0052 family)
LEAPIDEEKDLIFETKPKFSIGTIILLEEIISLLSIGVLEIIINEKFEPQQGTSNQRTTEVVPSIAKITKFNVKPKILLENKVYPKSYYYHNQANVEVDETPTKIEVDETPTKIQVQNFQIVGWILTEEQQLVKLNLGTKPNP